MGKTENQSIKLLNDKREKNVCEITNINNIGCMHILIGRVWERHKARLVPGQQSRRLLVRDHLAGDGRVRQFGVLLAHAHTERSAGAEARVQQDALDVHLRQRFLQLICLVIIFGTSEATHDHPTRESR